jgi:hypothetical protein
VAAPKASAPAIDAVRVRLNISDHVPFLSCACAELSC